MEWLSLTREPIASRWIGGWTVVLLHESVPATDVCGGLIVSAVAKDRESVGADFDDLLEVPVNLPVKMNNAIARNGGHSSWLVFEGGFAYRGISSGGRVAVGLLLVLTGQ